MQPKSLPQFLLRLGLLATVLSNITVPAAATVIAGNFGPGDTYQLGTGNASAVGGTSDESLAVSFTIPVGQNYSFDQFRVADNWFSGTDSLTAGLYSGSDPSTATLLESFTFSAATMFDSQIFTATSALHPMLLSGQTYLIEELSACPVGGPACPTTFGWQKNSIGDVGAYSLNNNHPWEFLTTNPATGAAVATPVFDVSGTLVPEPATVAFFGAGLLGVGVMRRRKKKAA
jgi:hypothetical protein